MPEQELLNYINQTQTQGFSEKEIRAALKEAGWTDEEIAEGFQSIKPTKKNKAFDLPREPGFFSRYKKLLIISLVVIVVIPLITYLALLIYQGSNQSNIQQELEETARQQTLEEQQREQERLEAEREQQAISLRDEKRINDIQEIQTALQSYFEQNNQYPQTLTELNTAGILLVVPKNPEGDSYLYTPLGNPASHYSLSFVLEARVGSLELGLQVVTSEKLLNADEVKSEEQTIRGARAVNQADGLKITNLAESTFLSGEEVFLEVKRLDDGHLNHVVLLTEGLKLVDRVSPFGFKFSAPREPGVYKIEAFGFDESGTSFSALTTLTIR